METALHGSEVIDLRTFLEREGADKKAWKIKPRCPECGDEVHPFNVKAAKPGFDEVSHEIVGRGRQKPGFDHKDNPFDDCPNSSRNDPRFDGLKDAEIDARTRERNLAILMRTDVRQMNHNVLTILMGELTGRREIAKEDREAIWRVGKRWLLGMSALGEHPWLMPYALAMLQPKHEFRNGNGELVYRPISERKELSYIRVDGRTGALRIPKAMQLSWANKAKSGLKYKPFLKRGTTAVIFEISEEAAHELNRSYSAYGLASNRYMHPRNE